MCDAFEVVPQLREAHEENARLRAGLTSLRNDWGLHNEVRRQIDILLVRTPRPPREVAPLGEW